MGAWARGCVERTGKVMFWWKKKSREKPVSGMRRAGRFVKVEESGFGGEKGDKSRFRARRGEPPLRNIKIHQRATVRYTGDAKPQSAHCQTPGRTLAERKTQQGPFRT